MKKNIKFILIGVFLLINTIISIFYIQHQKKLMNEEKKEPSSQVSDDLVESFEDGITDSDIDTPSNEKNHESSNEFTFENKSNPLLSDAKNTSYEIEIRYLFRDFKFAEGVEKLQEILSSHTVASESSLNNLYREGSIMISIPYFDADGTVEVLHTFKDAENLLIATLLSNPDARPEVILYEDSLNPILTDGDSIHIINKYSETEGEGLERLRILYPEVDEIITITFEVESNTMQATILIDKQGYAKLYSIDSEEELAPYISLKLWKMIRSSER